MSVAFSFSQLLRPVGQMLEPLQIESFSLKVEDGGVAVFADKPETPSRPAQNVSLKVSWQIFRRKNVEPEQEPQPSSGSLEIHYSHDDIARMDSEGQGKRTGAPGSPEAHTLSQILRAVGAFVDQKQGRLLGVVKEGQDISIEYESALKRALTEKFTVASLYDYWVKMYLRRRERTSV
jgi:hypothetical protein